MLKRIKQNYHISESDNFVDVNTTNRDIKVALPKSAYEKELTIRNSNGMHKVIVSFNGNDLFEVTGTGEIINLFSDGKEWYSKSSNTNIDITAELNQVSSQLAEKLNLADLSETGRKIKIVACVIRNDGTGWKFIEDMGHSKLNFLSVTADTDHITLNYNFQAKNILSFVACVDDTFAQLGYFAGASVGDTLSNIWIAQTPTTPVKSGVLGGYVKFDGTSWVISSGGGNITFGSFTAGELTLNHDNITLATSYMVSATARDGGYNVKAAGQDQGYSKFKFYDNAGTLITTPDVNMKFYFMRGNNTVTPNTPVKLNPQTVVNANGNIWCLGVFEVN